MTFQCLLEVIEYKRLFKSFSYLLIINDKFVKFSRCMFKLTVKSDFDLNLSTRFKFSISTSQFDSKSDSNRVVNKSKLDLVELNRIIRFELSRNQFFDQALVL